MFKPLTKHITLTGLLVLTVLVAAIVLSLQLPFLYYSDDIVFHAAKIQAAMDGDFFTDPITGFHSLYPPLFHVIAGSAANLLDLTSFQISRGVQLVQFLGLLASAFFLFSIVLCSPEKAALGTLLLVFTFYAPSGKYWLIHNPFNFSVMFTLAGVALLLSYLRTERLWQGLLGAFIAGIAVNIWWWNIIPVMGIVAGMLLTSYRQGESGCIRRRLVLPGLAFLFACGFTAWSLYEIRDVLPDYGYDMHAQSYAGQHGLGATFGNWVSHFLLKGNQQFFKYLYPAALDSSSRMVVVYGLVASVYYYLFVLPLNWFMIVVAARETVARRRLKRLGGRDLLVGAAVITFVLSIAALFRTDPSVMRRIQFYCYIFVIPTFVVYLYRVSNLNIRRTFIGGVALICSLALLYSVVYRPGFTLSRPVSDATLETEQFIEALDNNADRRIFVTEFDNHRLAREVRYRSFLLRGNPIYFRQDKRQADSVEFAYQRIVERGDRAEKWLKEFGTEYAVIGKTAFNISPVASKTTANPLGAEMAVFFRSHSQPVLENEEWVVFRLVYPFAADDDDER